jgi:hypothetical protein
MTAPEVCTVDFLVTLTTAFPNLNVRVNNNMGNGQYSKSYPMTGLTLQLNNVPIYDGWNNINVQANMNQPPYTWTYNGFNMDVLKGSVYVPPITANVTGSTAVSLQAGKSSISEKYYDALLNTSVSITGVIQNAVGGIGYYYHRADPNWSPVGAGGPITLGSGNTYSLSITLRKGWNLIDLSDSQNGGGTYFRVYIYAANGTVPPPPDHVLTNVGGTTVAYGTYNGMFQYNAGSNCTVAISGQTKINGNVQVYMNISTGTAGYNEWQSIPAANLSAPVNGYYGYTFTQNLYNGINRVDINDGNGNWQGVEVTSTCATVPVPFAITGIYDGATATGTPLTLDTINYVYHATGGKVTITGTAKSGATINAFNQGQTATTTSSGTFSLTIDVFTGWNFISVNDGNNWIYPNVDTPNGTAYTPPINTVTITPGAGGTFATVTSGGQVSDTYMNVNTDADALVINGNSKNAGAGSYYLNGTLFPLSFGTTFTATVPLIFGNNYIDLNDPMGNWYSIYVYTSGGVGAPIPYVTITSPAHGAAASGPVTVTGSIDPGFVPSVVYGWVYDYTTYTSTYFSSDAINQQMGDLPVTWNGGSFSFNASVNNGNMTVIEARACDSISGMCHGQDIYVNNTNGYTPYSWKAGAAYQRSNATAAAHKQRFIQKTHKQ